MKINIINKSGNPLPTYLTEGSAGMDLYANLNKNVLILPLRRELIPTGIFIELPMGYEAQIRPRSGMAIKSGLTIINTPGTVDSDYRGEIMICLVNLNEDINCIVRNGDRIAQMIISKHETAEWNVVETLSNTQRGSGGFGSSGK